MLTIEPPPCSSIAGRKARIMRYMAVTLRSKEKAQAFSSVSRMVPCSTKPAQLTRTLTSVSRAARPATASRSRTSSRSVVEAVEAGRSARLAGVEVGGEDPRSLGASATAVARPMPGAGRRDEAALAVQSVHESLPRAFSRLVRHIPGGCPPTGRVPGGTARLRSVLSVPRPRRWCHSARLSSG